MSNELEARIKKANLKYRKEKTAVIEKLETPVLLTKNGVIPQQSTIDFMGVFSELQEDAIDPGGIYTVGRGIAFDAKECKSKTSFPLSNIHQHQLAFLDYFEAAGGLAFFLIHFYNVHPDSAFVTPIELIHKYWDDQDGRRSIPLKAFNKDWLTNIDDYIAHFR